MNNLINEPVSPNPELAARYGYNPIEGFHREDAPLDCTVNGIDFRKLPPILRTLLVSDGTVTKFLEAYYWEPIRVKKLFHRDFKATEDLPAIDIKKDSHVLHRRVLLCGIRTARIYSYALSYIRADLLWPGVRDDLVQGRLGIGELLRDKRVETYRELLDYEMTPAGELATELGAKEEDLLISRSYRIFVNRSPCLYIIEKFPISHFS